MLAEEAPMAAVSPTPQLSAVDLSGDAEHPAVATLSPVVENEGAGSAVETTGAETGNNGEEESSEDDREDEAQGQPVARLVIHVPEDAESEADEVVETEQEIEIREIVTACVNGDNQAIVNMMQAGVDIASICPGEDIAPVHIAAAHGRIGALALLARKCDVNMRSASGGTALHCAALNGQARAAKQLLLLGANPNAVDKHGCTPLILAAFDNSPAGAEVVKVLLGWGAMPQMADETNRTAAEVAHLRGNTTALAALTAWPEEIMIPETVPTLEEESTDVHDITFLSSVAEAAALAQALEGNKYTPHAGKLSLAGSCLPAEACAPLAQAFRVNETVTELNLAGMLRSADHATLLCSALETNSCITALDISSSDAVGVAGMKAIGHLLAKNRCLRRLDVSFSIQAGNEIAAIASGLDSNAGLETLILVSSNCTPRLFGGAGVRALVAALQKHKTLQRISLARSVGCSATELTELPAALAAAPALRAVDLTGCDVPPPTLHAVVDAVKGKDGFELLADAPFPSVLRKARQLHVAIEKLKPGKGNLFDISFAGCITDENEAIMAMEAVAKNRTVASVGLQDCRLGAGGVAALTKYIAETDTLSTLNLTSALDSPDEVIAIAKALMGNNSVKQMTLRGCPATRPVISALKECLLVNTCLQRIKGMSGEALESLSPLLEVNTAINDSRLAVPTLLPGAVRLGKLSTIKMLVQRYPHLVTDVHNPDKSGELHALLLQASEKDSSETCHDALHAVFKTRWCFDEAVAKTIRSSTRTLDAFARVCMRLAEEGWLERDTGRTVLHTVLDECRFLNLEEAHAVKLARAILRIKPELENTADAAGVSPAEIAASCAAPHIQSMFIMGIIAALQRKGRELKTAQQVIRKAGIDASGEADDAVAHHAAQMEQRALAAEAEVIELRRMVQWQRATIETLQQAPTETVGAPALQEPQVEIECIEFDHEGTTYWLDEQSGKVYSAEDKFVGKLTRDKEIDFGANDSDDEDAGVNVTPTAMFEQTDVAKAIDVTV
eukprot:m.188268 g.188268  ORF g.188268 m.188268 type:complete len:1018 (+) comp17372_c0_seq1:263-3316(+)